MGDVLRRYWYAIAAAGILVYLAWKGSQVLAVFTQFKEIIEREARAYSVPVAWIQAFILTESSGDPNAYRAEPKINDASYGLMQLLTRTARALGYQGTPEGLYDPATNVHYGVKLMGQLRDQYGDDIRRVYSAYNSGKPDRYLTNPQVGANVARLLVNLAKVTA